MDYLKIFFWILIFFIFYPYVGYPVLLWCLSIFRKRRKDSSLNKDYEPTVTLFVTAYNEEDFVDAKIANSRILDYPADKLEFVWVTDGSDDKTNELLSKYPEVRVLFEPERKGKINAMNRGMDFIDSEIVIFSDGNTLLNKNSIREIVNGFSNSKVGCIAGEKRIEITQKEDAAATGEGLYWKYESWIKKLDSSNGSCVGAAGELFAIRKNLFFKVSPDTILDDFIISLTIAMQGYKIDYAPDAYATENPSDSIKEEMKRKIRIAAGSVQSLIRLKSLLNIFKYRFLSFQYFSHKVMRWIVSPLSMLLLIPLNLILALHFYEFKILLGVHILFYLFVLLGWIFKDKKTGLAFLFLPFYFFMANLAMYLGFIRYYKGTQSVNWERAKRAVK